MEWLGHNVVRRTTHTEEKPVENERAPVGKMEAQLQQWGTKLDAFIAEAEKVDTEAKIDYRKRVDELKAKFQAAQSKLDALKAASSEKWGTFQTDLETSWQELEVAFKNLTN
jgi:hypothetical protein